MLDAESLFQEGTEAGLDETALAPLRLAVEEAIKARDKTHEGKSKGNEWSRKSSANRIGK